MKQAIVIGAGFSGLASAYYLSKRGYRVGVYEAGARIGGLIDTVHTPVGMAERAANGLIRSHRVESLFQDLGLSFAEASPYQKNKFIYRDGLHRWPLTSFETIQAIGKLIVSTRGNRGRLAPRPQESVRQWGERLAGSKFVDFIVEPAFQGVYASLSSNLSAQAVWMGFQSRKKQKGTVAPLHGMSELINAMGDFVVRFGGQIDLDSPIDNLSQITPRFGGPIFLCAPALQNAILLEHIAPPLVKALKKIEMLPLVSATLFFRPLVERINGFGCLFPARSHFNSLGVLFNHGIFKLRPGEYSERWILGQPSGRNNLKKTDLEMIELILSDRKRFKSFTHSRFHDVRPIKWEIHRVPEAVPLYSEAILEVVRQLSALPDNIRIVGNYLGRLGLSGILELAYDTVYALS